MTIHDELAVEMARNCADHCHILRMRELMSDNEGAFELNTPVKTEIVVRTWDKPRKIDLEV